MLKKTIIFYFLILFSLLLFICAFILPNILENKDLIVIPPSEFVWPSKYTTITSYFGNRTAPTTGASKYHSGIDIGAPEGSSIYSICDGYISFTGFSGANGYTVTVKSTPYLISYCHVNPDFEVEISEFVSKGEKIATVGPKYVPESSNNPYKDSARKINKWCNNWSTSSSDHKKRRPSY